MTEQPGRRYGQAGKSLTGEDARRRFGTDNARAGASGERAFSLMLSRSPETRQYMRWESLSIPAGPREKRYSGDVDFALASGTRLLLVDCKMWAGGKVYWTFMGRPMRGLSPMKDQMSRNMELALSRYSDRLPNHRVEACVVFVPTHNGSLPMSVGLLRWPGGIHSFLPQDGLRNAARVLGAPETPSPAIQGLIGSLIR